MIAVNDEDNSFQVEIVTNQEEHMSILSRQTSITGIEMNKTGKQQHIAQSKPDEAFDTLGQFSPQRQRPRQNQIDFAKDFQDANMWNESAGRPIDAGASSTPKSVTSHRKQELTAGNVTNKFMSNARQALSPKSNKSVRSKRSGIHISGSKSQKKSLMQMR